MFFHNMVALLPEDIHQYLDQLNQAYLQSLPKDKFLLGMANPRNSDLII